MILVSVSSYSQRIRTIGTDTFVAFTREQAKAINDTFIVQKQTIKTLKHQDSVYTVTLKQVIASDSIQKVKDSITYYQQILPLLNEVKTLLVAQIETPFKHNFEIGVGGGLSTYFGAYRPFSKIVDGTYYMPLGVGVLKYNFHKHLSSRLEVFATQAFVPTLLNKSIVAGTLMADYNIAPNMYSIRVGAIPVVSIGYNIFGLSNETLVIGAGIKAYYTAKTALEVNIRYGLSEIDNVKGNDHFVRGHIILTRRLF